VSTTSGSVVPKLWFMNHRLCRIFQEVHVEKFLKINFFVCVAVLFEEKLTD
jgi:hypothetical protein